MPVQVAAGKGSGDSGQGRGWLVRRDGTGSIVGASLAEILSLDVGSLDSVHLSIMVIKES